MASAEKLRQEAIVMKALLSEIDRFVLTLTERLENPNKSFGPFGSPAPVAESDVEFQKCSKGVQALIGNILPYRALFGAAPPQYQKLRGILEKTVPQQSPKDKYSDSKTEFFYRMRNFMLILSQPSSAEKVPQCKPYVRVMNLFMNTTTDAKDKFKYDGMYTELANIVKKVEDVREKAEVDAIISYMKDEYKQGLQSSLPAVPDSTVRIEEPPPRFTEADVSAELAAPPAPTPAAKKPLTPADNMKVSAIAAQLVNNPKVKSRNLNMTQIRQMAENIYRKQTGKGRRKSYRKKKSIRKSRKIHRM